jgi:hypothetical protein
MGASSFPCTLLFLFCFVFWPYWIGTQSLMFRGSTTWAIPKSLFALVIFF